MLGGDTVSKNYHEVTGEIVQELIKAKAQVIGEAGNSTMKQELLKEHLSDEAIINSFKAIFAAVNNPTE